jgi:hypothetical protein
MIPAMRPKRCESRDDPSYRVSNAPAMLANAHKAGNAQGTTVTAEDASIDLAAVETRRNAPPIPFADINRHIAHRCLL